MVTPVYNKNMEDCYTLRKLRVGDSLVMTLQMTWCSTSLNSRNNLQIFNHTIFCWTYFWVPQFHSKNVDKNIESYSIQMHVIQLVFHYRQCCILLRNMYVYSGWIEVVRVDKPTGAQPKICCHACTHITMNTENIVVHINLINLPYGLKMLCQNSLQKAKLCWGIVLWPTPRALSPDLECSIP